MGKIQYYTLNSYLHFVKLSIQPEESLDGISEREGTVSSGIKSVQFTMM